MMVSKRVSVFLQVLFLMSVFLLNYYCSEGWLDQERLALLQLKPFLNNSQSLTNWVEGDGNSDCCQWEGVECNNTGRVIELHLENARDWGSGKWYLNASLFTPFEELQLLDLSSNSIAGCIEDEGLERLSKLSNLKVLNLGSNLFNNSILSSLDRLSSLRALTLDYNNLKGTIDVGGFLNLKNLKYLNMAGNSFHQISGLMNSLKVLSLSNCELTGTLSDQGGLCELVHLRELYVDGNDLHGILPRCLANMTSLQVFVVTSNQLTGNLFALANMTYLRLLDVSSNQFTENIYPLKHLTFIQDLKLSNNHFQISISLEFLYNHSNLKSFDGENNQIYAETESHSILPKFQLDYLSLGGYGDGGTFPKFLYYQHKLEQIHLCHINLTGEFPNWLLENNTKLDTTTLINNSLSGPFHMPIHSHRQLTIMDVSNNFFQGHIPAKIGTFLPSLIDLNMSINAFNGSIPSSFGNMKSLISLDLSNNQLTGGIPEYLAMGCFSLRFLVLSNNKLQGHLFSKSFNLTDLRRLQLDNNHFNGEIPECLSNNSFFGGLYLSNNNISGGIPRWLGNITYLEDIMLSNNHLEGLIPVEFCQLDFLQILDLSKNNIYGNLPSCFSPFHIKQVHLSKNMLQGRLKNGTFWNSPSLMTLDLSYNQFNGVIPSWIDRLSQLRYLLLANNNLKGEVPVELCRLNQLQLIDLSHNNLSGQILSCLDNTTLHKDYYNVATPTSSSWNFLGLYGLFDPNSVTGPSMGKEEDIMFTTKKISYSYHGRPLESMFGVDFSCNKLASQIPLHMGYLIRIRALNLSHNNLIGTIPVTFENLQQIESLDLSFNNLYGKIPSQLVNLTTLAVFSVAYNNLSGKTPELTAQFSTFNESSYEGNPFLCGQPLPESCNQTRSPSLVQKAPISSENASNLIDMDSFYITFTVSYMIALLGIIVALYVNPYWQQGWLYLIEMWINSCYYFVVDHLPMRL